MINNIFNIFKYKINSKKISIIVTGMYFLFHLFVVINYECWRDESQAWLIAKNLSYIDIFKELCVEGHPCLWFLLIAPFAKLGMSFYYFNLISLSLCTIAVYILLRYSPFSFLVNIAIIFSSMFLYYNPVVCRSYSMISLLVVILAKEFNNRENHPILYSLLISLLIQSHIVIYGLCFGLMVELIIFLARNNKISSKHRIISVLLPILSSILLFIELIPRKNYPAYTSITITSVIDNLNINWIIRKLNSIGYVSWGIRNKVIIIAILIIFLILSIMQIILIIKNDNHKFTNRILISFCAIGYYFAISILAYSSHSQLASILMMTVVFSAWIICENNEYPKHPTIVFLLLASALTFIPSQSI